MESDNTDPPKHENKDVGFKKPMLIGKISKCPRKVTTITVNEPPLEKPDLETKTEPTELKPPEAARNIPYNEPEWSDLPISSSDYILEVLKNGAIIETISLMERPFWLFGRLTNCDICMQHPTISRYHAVLQFRASDDTQRGFYIYDLESTHGTFLNKNRIRPRSYVRVKVGHMLKLGCSTRTYILNGPCEDCEEESPLSVTELMQKRNEELRLRELEKMQAEERKKREEEGGIDWGLGEDADEEVDLGDNPYALTNNEELYLEDPKKALRGFFEREGFELEYDCSEQGIGQFLCKVELPIDDEIGKPIFAEVVHKGKKKEAVVQCALEACRMLDRQGLLRQATHESKKRKPKNWEENDYYDSDDDTFLDRTGTVEKKRQIRMTAKVPQKAETYETLLQREAEISSCIRKLELEIADSQKTLSFDNSDVHETADSLDSFMLELKQSKPTKQSNNKLKSELVKLKQEHSNIIRLVNIAKPASLPPIRDQYAKNLEKTLPSFGKRKTIKAEIVRTNPEELRNNEQDDQDEEEEENQKMIRLNHTEDIRNNEDKTEQHEEEEEQVKKETTDKQRDDKQAAIEETHQKEIDAEIAEKRRRKNQRRIQQRHEKAEIQKQKGYDEDANKEDYNMWVPPSGQSGDGRTALNDKYGY